MVQPAAVLPTPPHTPDLPWIQKVVVNALNTLLDLQRWTQTVKHLPSKRPGNIATPWMFKACESPTRAWYRLDACGGEHLWMG